MDLLDRGWSMRDVGRRLTWFDVLTLFRHLPHDSETRKLVTPEHFLEGELDGVTNQMIGEVVDALKIVGGKLGGADAETLQAMPSTIDVILQNHRADGVEKAPAPRESSSPAVEPEKKSLTPSEIRAEVARRQKKV